jgi:hypothetical protein
METKVGIHNKSRLSQAFYRSIGDDCGVMYLSGFKNVEGTWVRVESKEYLDLLALHLAEFDIDSLKLIDVVMTTLAESYAELKNDLLKAVDKKKGDQDE